MGDVPLGTFTVLPCPGKIEGKTSPNVTLLRGSTLIHLLDGSGRMIEESEEIHIIGELCISREAKPSIKLTSC